MNMNYEALDLRAFLAVAECGSFHAAAAALHVSQPALSRRIQRLEEMVGAALLERTTRRVALTAFGGELLPRVRRLVDELDASLFGLRHAGGRDPPVTLACVPTAAFYFLPAVIGRFGELFPEVRFRILDLSATAGLEAVSRGEADFGINFLGASDAGLSFEPLLEDPFVLACRRDHPLASREAVDWADLEPYRLVTVGRESGNRVLLETALARAEVRMRCFYEVTHLSTSLGLVEAGLGVSVLPRLATPQGDHPIIVTRPITPRVTRTIGIVARRGKPLAPVAARFRDLLIETWADRGAADEGPAAPGGAGPAHGAA
ncbi:LysR substrate-binding domain-containing protein [Rhodoplanes sp. TEM]|uniref:LysR substrate-binding domain-containing protein n=1 Tax=Rhodoplanes tepidamans TaxID=200616 RepID=A0ABT5JJ47_RHOTP|nr:MULTISPECIES: LysR family transcriptional regulator [Rhodoplanes]MDC7789627.1 LysR substrate-binding domain-containing protein [Rhodoplanes tepidamans]MDC7987381.1 LysR substrate-binding domain-containing protein [Rhodoplanes sp. TEM]MDQ0359182.1 DNA-binding transcriptional LysR family regulator [Rhodoplanes tepidamans]